MIIQISDNIILSQNIKNDKPFLIEYLNDPDIFNNTLKIPYPYTEKDADNWIKHAEDKKYKDDLFCNFAIRDKKMNLMGGIGFHMKYGPESHKDEIGYWLAKKYWNNGIMTEVVRGFCDYGFNSINLVRIEAHLFEYNLSSARVLEKCGFKKEGILKKYYNKNGQIIDSILYALVKE